MQNINYMKCKLNILLQLISSKKKNYTLVINDSEFGLNIFFN